MIQYRQTYRRRTPMKAQPTLPETYREIFSIHLQKDKRLALLVNVLALLITVVLFLPMLFFVPFSTLFEGASLLKFLTLLFGYVLYLILHELVHGIAMKLCGTKKVKYGFTGMYAFAGSDDYYSKGAYIFIALAPIVVWGIVFAILNIVVPQDWFWVIYLLQISNLSGAAGDLYVTFRFSKLPRDILVRDSGVSMQVFSDK